MNRAPTLGPRSSGRHRPASTSRPGGRHRHRCTGRQPAHADPKGYRHRVRPGCSPAVPGLAAPARFGRREGRRHPRSTGLREAGLWSRGRCRDQLPEPDCLDCGWALHGDCTHQSTTGAVGSPSPKPWPESGGCGGSYDTRRVFRFMKSMRMNCPSVIVLVK
jgi:hypothetical protein